MNRNWFIDACVIIYFMEANGDKGEILRSRISTHLQKNGIISVSRLSCLECRVLPLRRGDSVLVARYSQFFALPHLRIIELTPEVIEVATELRVRYPLRTPDALQAACSLQVKADKFLTADKQFKSVQELSVELV